MKDPNRAENTKVWIKESALAHQFLDGLTGLEIGGAAHNQFGLNTLNVDYTADENTPCKKQEMAMCGETLAVDIVASGDNIPVADNSQDFVVSSHVIEHFFDPIAALKEWTRITKPGGYIFMIVPDRDRVSPDSTKPLTSLEELVRRHEGKIPWPDAATQLLQPHYSFWDVPRFLELCWFLGLPVVRVQYPDDKGSNGFTVVVKKGVNLVR